jgi:hypothetical protein
VNQQKTEPTESNTTGNIEWAPRSDADRVHNSG